MRVDIYLLSSKQNHAAFNGGKVRLRAGGVYQTEIITANTRTFLFELT